MTNIIKFEDQDMLDVIEFAQAYWDKEISNSRRRNDAVDPARRIIQTVAGKLGELAVAHLLETDDAPDFVVYARGTKMSRPDLTIGGANLHVKTCIHPENSWIADPNTDNIVNKPVPGDIVVFAVFRPVEGTVEVLGVIQAEKLNGLWRAPKSPKLAHKRALYWEQQGGFNPPMPLKDHPDLVKLA